MEQSTLMATAVKLQQKLANLISEIVFLALLFVLFATPQCAAEDISVRLLDARNGRPYAHRLIVLAFHRVPSYVVEDIPGSAPLKAETNNDGIASFHVPDGSPRFVEVLPQGNLGLCSDLPPVELRTIITSGLVSHCSAATGCHCKVAKSISTLVLTPGQVVLLARPRGIWQRLLDRLFPE